MDLVAVQRRTLRLLFATQVISGIGVAIGASVGALLAAELASVTVSGFAVSTVVVGAALLALPASEIVRRSGRRLSLATTYFVAAIGAIVVVVAAMQESIALLFVGFFLFGGGSAAGLQARYAAVDLAPAPQRGRHLSVIFWATTLGAVAGPNLAAVAGTSLAGYGVPTLAGPFVFSAALFVLAAVVFMLLMRPDPAVLARSVVPLSTESAEGRTRSSLRTALAVVVANPSARLGVIAMAVGHLVMNAVMAMTPVHIRGGAHDAADTLRIVGIVLSIHVAGMYAFSPVIGWLTDRFGRRPIIVTGLFFLLAACALAGTAGHDSSRLAAGLFALGIGWSSTVVAGSTLLSDSIAADLRPSAQGLSDLTMGLAGASAGALSGVVMQGWGYSMLALFAALVAAPFVLVARRRFS